MPKVKERITRAEAERLCEAGKKQGARKLRIEVGEGTNKMVLNYDFRDGGDEPASNGANPWDEVLNAEDPKRPS